MIRTAASAAARRRSIVVGGRGFSLLRPDIDVGSAVSSPSPRRAAATLRSGVSAAVMARRTTMDFSTAFGQPAVGSGVGILRGNGYGLGTEDRVANAASTTWQQRRAYHASVVAESQSDDDEDNDDDDCDFDDEFEKERKERRARSNLVSKRLYRILFRECRGSGRRGDESEGSKTILLQPPIDPRMQGFAKVVRARRGEDVIVEVGADINKVGGDIGMAMEVLRFVHASLGGDPSDDLEEYYLGRFEDRSVGDVFEALEEGSLGESADVAGRHAEGHYTQFVDNDEDDDDETDGDSDDDDDDDDPLETDLCVLVSPENLITALRLAFRAPLAGESDDHGRRRQRRREEFEAEENEVQRILRHRHRDAIDASSLLSEQIRAWEGKSSIFVDRERGVRVVATARFVGMRVAVASSPIGVPKPRAGVGVGTGGNGGGKGGRMYQFSYRIRVENIRDIDSDVVDNEETPAATESASENAVQLLGRTWRIAEEADPPSVPNVGDERDEEDGNGGASKYDQRVHEPRTGAVGHLPVIRPGEVFEYYSAVESGSRNGKMEGSFHMAAVEDATTESAHIGEPVTAFEWDKDDSRFFEAPVGAFGLVVDDGIDGTDGT